MSDHENTHDEEPAEDLTEEPVENDGADLTEEPEVDSMRAMAEAFKGNDRASSGTYESKLTAAQNETLDRFVEWLRTEDPKGVKTDNTSSSYKSYVAQALVHFQNGGSRKDLSTDVKSGVNAFARFLDATQASA